MTHFTICIYREFDYFALHFQFYLQYKWNCWLCCLPKLKFFYLFALFNLSINFGGSSKPNFHNYFSKLLILLLRIIFVWVSPLILLLNCFFNVFTFVVYSILFKSTFDMFTTILHNSLTMVGWNQFLCNWWFVWVFQTILITL
jgi:hypothetical protein